jgi:hypothetical protein
VSFSRTVRCSGEFFFLKFPRKLLSIGIHSLSGIYVAVDVHVDANIVVGVPAIVGLPSAV